VETIASSISEDLRKSWGWFFALGALLVIIGIGALGSSVAATLITTTALGVILFVGGCAEVVTSFMARTWRGFAAYLLMGILMAISGFFLMTQPLVGSATLTVLVATLLLVAGTGRVAFAIVDRYPRWGWGVASGVLSVLLGGLVFAQYPSSSLYFIGTIVGCELILRGAGWISLALGAHRVSKQLDEVHHAA